MARIPEVVVAMDWGGTWARASVADKNGELLWNTRLPNVVGVFLVHALPSGSAGLEAGVPGIR